LARQLVEHARHFFSDFIVIQRRQVSRKCSFAASF
jgi:hypothetical protein